MTANSRSLALRIRSSHFFFLFSLQKVRQSDRLVWFHRSLSIDSVTLSLSHKAQLWGTFFRWVRCHSTWAQPTRGKGGFAISFYVLLGNAASATAQVPTIAGFASCRVSRACSWFVGLCPATFVLVYAVLVSIGQQPPTASFSGSDNKSPLPLRISNPCDTNVQL